MIAVRPLFSERFTAQRREAEIVAFRAYNELPRDESGDSSDKLANLRNRRIGSEQDGGQLIERPPTSS